MGSRFQEGGLSYTIADQVAVAGHDQMKISAYQQPKKQLSYTIRERISPELYAKLQDAPAGSKEIPTSVPNHERISSNVQAIFDRFSTHVCRGDIKDELIIGKSLLVAQKKEGIISEVNLKERSCNGNESFIGQEMAIVFDGRKEPRVDLTEEGKEYTTTTLEYGYIDHSGEVLVKDNVVIRSNYCGDGSGLSDEGISMYSFSKKSLHFLSGIELSVTEDQEANQLIIRDDPYIESGVRFPLRKINVYEALQGFEEQLASGGSHTKGIFNL